MSTKFENMFILFFLLKDSLARYRILVFSTMDSQYFEDIFHCLLSPIAASISADGSFLQDDLFPTKMTVIPLRII